MLLDIRSTVRFPGSLLRFFITIVGIDRDMYTIVSIASQMPPLYNHTHRISPNLEHSSPVLHQIGESGMMISFLDITYAANETYVATTAGLTSGISKYGDADNIEHRGWLARRTNPALLAT